MELFLNQISSRHNLDYTNLLGQWENFNNEHSRLNKMKKPELLTICKENGFCCKGSKPDLIKNIINKTKITPNKMKILVSKIQLIISLTVI